ncbi:MAG TPA: hypothetical protein VJN69_05025 [Candidatus Acidoferrales bacterium]|nr:hypothetical protein [Candidatus Acidoferrales bacterium]
MKRMILVLAALGFAVPAFATPSVAVKCAANEERVWVYDNLTTWDVSARLKCGALVAVVGAEKGYVRVRTADGNEGYVPAAAVPSSELAHVIVVVNPAATVSVAAVARANLQTESAQPASAMPVSHPAPSYLASAPRPVEVARVEAMPAPAPAPPASPAPPVNMAYPVTPVPPAPSPAQESRPAPASVPDPVQAPVPVPSALPITRTSSDGSMQSYVRPTPAPRPIARGDVAREDATLVVEDMNTPVPPPASESAPKVVKAANFMTITRKRSSIPSHTPEYSDDVEDMPDANAVPTEDLSACSVYFSVYGVTPIQYKWIADERGKQFPGVCPAPEPSMVDYVVIFTHDLDSFITTLPEAIHTDSNGFSDWTPVTAADDTQIPASELDRARREYAWVFRVRRGTYDPAKVTPRWRPLYTKTDHESSRSIQDAMQFMASNASVR